MSLTRAARLCLVYVAIFKLAFAIPEGDEVFDTQVGGRFYVFADKAIQVVDPVTLSIVANITRDNLGSPLTNNGSVGGSTTTSRSWNDAVLVEDSSLSLRQIYVNEGDIYMDSNGTEFSYVTVIDASTSRIIARQKVGAIPVHIYYVAATSSAWSHSDAQGTFFVLTPKSRTAVSLQATVPSFVSTQAHGKLVVNVALQPLSYGSNVGEQVLEKINLTSATRIAHFNYSSSLSNSSICTGTHTIVYSQVNQHVYAECVDGAGTLEWNTKSDTFVALLDVVGTLYNAPAGDQIYVTNTDNSTAAVLRPGGNGAASSTFQYIEIPYQPSDPVLYSNATSVVPENASSYVAFFPTLRNTNVNDIKQAEDVGGSVLSPGYYGQNTADDESTPVDCVYDMSSATSTTGLQLANGTNATPQTPSCGACAAGIMPLDPTQYNTSLAGMGVIDLADVVGNASVKATLVPAGAVAPMLSLASNADQCSFAQVSRDAVRGGPFIALTADLPQSSIYILDASSPGDPLYGKGYVATADSPTTIVWVPNVDGVAPKPAPMASSNG